MLLGIFALLALLLASVGVYRLDQLLGGAADPRDRHSRGARRAPRQVLGQLMREGMTLALAGIAIGLVGAFLAARALSAFLFGVGDAIR